jgi:Flp pilus assembly protein TadG
MRPSALRVRIRTGSRCIAGHAPVRIGPRRARTRLLRDERGAVSAELVIATPLLLLLIMTVIQFALWEHAEHIATTVAQQGVSVGRLQNQTAGAGQQEAQSVLDQLGPSVLTGSKITATRTVQMTTVTVTGHAESIVGLFSLPVRATASGATENYTNPGQGP